MDRPINSAELARQISETLNLSDTETNALYDELSQIPNGPVKQALDGLLKKANCE